MVFGIYQVSLGTISYLAKKTKKVGACVLNLKCVGGTCALWVARVACKLKLGFHNGFWYLSSQLRNNFIFG